MTDISDYINRLIKAPPKRGTLREIAARPAIAAARGKAPYKAPTPTSGETGGDLLRKEVVVVFSSIIITADGAFERPIGWPDDGDYPASATVPTPLPSSLRVAGGVLSLDTEVQHYEQRRVHLALYDIDGVMQEDRFLLHHEAPFSGKYHAIPPAGYWTPTVWMSVAAGPLPASVTARIAALTAAGVITI